VRLVSEAPSQVIADLTPVAAYQMPAIDVAGLLAEDEARGVKAGAYRYGAEIPVEFDVKQMSTVTALPGGGSVYRMQIDSPGAHSLALSFSRFALPEGAGLWIHAADGIDSYGAFGAHNNKADGLFSIIPMPDDHIIVEYVEPGFVASPGELVIDMVVHGYRDVLGARKSDSYAGGSGGCNVDVNCSVGDPWQDQIRSVARTFSGGFLCTGALINNSANDGKQLFWTANHCGSMNNATFLFNYESSGCGSGGAPTNQSVQGSVLLANNSSVDYRLVRITGNIPDNYDVYFMGWNRGTANPPNTFSVHHPSGDRKKISFDDDTATKSGTDWRIAEWDLGVTEGGSSGSPLFDHNGRFIGQLCCGQAACGFPFNDYYGRFDLAWNNVNSELDPSGSGSMTLDGFDPDNPGGGSGTWTGLGGGLAGVLGSAPSLSGNGSMNPGTTTTLTMTGSLPNVTGTLVVGVSQANVPLKGGILIPSPTALVPVTTTIAGSLGLSSPWPAGIPPMTSIWYQIWVSDFGAPQGFAATNGLRGDTP